MPNCLNLPSVLNSGSYCLHGGKYHIVTWFNLVKPRDGDADVMGQCVFRKTLKKDPSWRELGRGGGTRGLPLVDGRSGKHAPSWQTQSWSWRAGCAPGDCLCASDGRGADYHHHSACHRVLRGKKNRGDKRVTGWQLRERKANNLKSASGKAPKKTETTHPSSTPQPVANPPYQPYPHLVPSLRSELPSHPARNAPRPLKENPRPTSVAIKRCTIIKEEVTRFWRTTRLHFSFAATFTDLGVYTFWRLPVAR